MEGETSQLLNLLVKNLPIWHFQMLTGMVSPRVSNHSAGEIFTHKKSSNRVAKKSLV